MSTLSCGKLSKRLPTNQNERFSQWRPGRMMLLHELHLHANVWWGAMLFVFGLIYCIRLAPKRPE
jgi:hypothetical protein